MNMDEDVDPFGEGAGYTGQLEISFLSENNPTSGTAPPSSFSDLCGFLHAGTVLLCLFAL